MKLFTLTALLALCTSIACAQPKAEVEITPYLRMDNYPSFVYTGGATDQTITLKGTSPGLNISYKKALSKKIYIKGTAGYYRYSFNNIRQQNHFGSTNTRLTTLPAMQGVFIPFTTDKYFYNTICLGVGTGKTFSLPKNIYLEAAGNINNYVTFSQNYHIAYDQSDDQLKNPYRTGKARYFAFEAGVQLSILKFTGRYKLGPTILLPVYNLWKTDDAFPGEENSGSRSKWLKGIGAGLTFNYPITKNK